jgi:FtsP/CotA-like multicopper oxidase with cupredoxin domain
MIVDRTKPARSGMGQWTINGKTYDPSAPLVIRTGTPCRPMVQNRSDDDHPMHLHRDSFELKSVNGTKRKHEMKIRIVPPSKDLGESLSTPEARIRT